MEKVRTVTTSYVVNKLRGVISRPDNRRYTSSRSSAAMPVLRYHECADVFTGDLGSLFLDFVVIPNNQHW